MEKTGCCFIALIVKLLTSLVSSFIIFFVVAVGANYSSPVFKMHKL